MDATARLRDNARVSAPLRELDDAELVERLAGVSFALFLDYDGTLTPIAARPELATLAEDQRERLRAVAARHPVAIVTGRGMADIRKMVGLPGLHYAANHGFEITGPDVAFEVDPELRRTFELVAAELEQRVSGIPGVAFESKGYSVAVHYRLTPDERVAEVESAVDEVVARTEGVRKGAGKRVFEIRPTLDWHKGSAVEWLIDRFGTSEAIYIGDDRTDEDAFAAIRRRHGIAIFVGDPTWPTAATSRLPDHDAVGTLLERLARL
jgi:trehalose-phosphatase